MPNIFINLLISYYIFIFYSNLQKILTLNSILHELFFYPNGHNSSIQAISFELNPHTTYIELNLFSY